MYSIHSFLFFVCLYWYLMHLLLETHLFCFIWKFLLFWFNFDLFVCVIVYSVCITVFVEWVCCSLFSAFKMIFLLSNLFQCLLVSNATVFIRMIQARVFHWGLLGSGVSIPLSVAVSIFIIGLWWIGFDDIVSIAYGCLCMNQSSIVVAWLTVHVEIFVFIVCFSNAWILSVLWAGLRRLMLVLLFRILWSLICWATLVWLV